MCQKKHSVIVMTFICWSYTRAIHNDIDLVFPKDFMFGVSTSAYQVEGAWNEEGKGESIWDRLVHTRPDTIIDHSNGDIACDSYHKTNEDVELLKNLKVGYYRFSISWARILPLGYTNNLNVNGVNYYNTLLDRLLANGITPVVTLYHWDLPETLQAAGGWPNDIIINLYLEYVRICFTLFGDRVKYWITFNEPYEICEMGYSAGEIAPLFNAQGIADYLCGHNLLIAHGNAYRLYEKEFKEMQKGKVGIAIDSAWFEPNSTTADDKEAASRTMQMNFGWFVHPIISRNGDYPKIMRDRIDRFSKEEGFIESRLPYFTKKEIELIRGTQDFIGLNYYTTFYVYDLKNNFYMQPSHGYDLGTGTWTDPQWELSANWIHVTPWGLRSFLNYMRTEYNNPYVIITENGYADDGNLNDCGRIRYVNSYLDNLLQAKLEDGCNVMGYFLWSFIDNFEWAQGYTNRYGLIHIDFEKPNRTRTPKMSYHVYRNIIETGRIDWNYTPSGFLPCVWIGDVKKIGNKRKNTTKT